MLREMNFGREVERDQCSDLVWLGGVRAPVLW